MPFNRFTIQKNFAISAGAGSGKTYTLSRRYINALLGFDYFREDYGTRTGTTAPSPRRTPRWRMTRSGPGWWRP